MELVFRELGETMGPMLKSTMKVVDKLRGPTVGSSNDAAPPPYVQLDLVLNPDEISALPFELTLRDGKEIFADPDAPLILTRRMKSARAPQAANPLCVF